MRKLFRRMLSFVVSLTILTSLGITSITASAEEGLITFPVAFTHVSGGNAIHSPTGEDVRLLNTLDPSFLEPNSSWVFARKVSVPGYTFASATKVSGGWNWIDGYWVYWYPFGFKTPLYYVLPHWEYTTPISYQMNYTAIPYTLTINHNYPAGAPHASYTATVSNLTVSTDISSYLVPQTHSGAYSAVADSAATTMPANDLTVNINYAANSFQLTVTHVYPGLGGAADTIVTTTDEAVPFGTDITGFFDDRVEPGFTDIAPTVNITGLDGAPDTMPANDVTATYTYSRNLNRVVVRHLTENLDGTYSEDPALRTPIANIPFGTVLNTIGGIQPVSIPGFTLDENRLPDLTASTLPDQPTRVRYYYTRNIHTLTVVHEYEDSDDYSEDFSVAYNTMLSDVPGTGQRDVQGYYVDTTPDLSVTMPDDDLTITYTYKLERYTVTVEFVDEDGDPLADSVTIPEVAYGTTLTAEDQAIAITGYTLSNPEDTLNVPDGDNILTLVYTLNTYPVTVRYLQLGTTTEIAPANTLPNVPFGSTVTTTTAGVMQSFNGYTYDSASPASLTVGTDGNILTLYYTANPVIYYFPGTVETVDIPEPGVPLVDIPDQANPTTAGRSVLPIVLTALTACATAFGLGKKKK